jgi:hypothetical protein
MPGTFSTASCAPYRDDRADGYAHACPIPAELLERPALEVARAVAALPVTDGEIRAARAEHALQRTT